MTYRKRTIIWSENDWKNLCGSLPKSTWMFYLFTIVSRCCQGIFYKGLHPSEFWLVLIQYVVPVVSKAIIRIPGKNSKAWTYQLGIIPGITECWNLLFSPSSKRSPRLNKDLVQFLNLWSCSKIEVGWESLWKTTWLVIFLTEVIYFCARVRVGVVSPPWLVLPGEGCPSVMG